MITFKGNWIFLVEEKPKIRVFSFLERVDMLKDKRWPTDVINLFDSWYPNLKIG